MQFGVARSCIAKFRISFFKNMMRNTVSYLSVVDFDAKYMSSTTHFNMFTTVTKRHRHYIQIYRQESDQIGQEIKFGLQTTMSDDRRWIDDITYRRYFCTIIHSMLLKRPLRMIIESKSTTLIHMILFKRSWKDQKCNHNKQTFRKLII